MDCEELQSLHESATDPGEPKIERESALFLMHVSNQLFLGHSGVDTLCSCNNYLLSLFPVQYLMQFLECSIRQE